MPSFNSQELEEWTQGAWLAQPKGEISGFCFDARQIRPGQCFVALSGGARDGHDFIEQAAAGGAAAALVEHAVDLALPQLQVADSLVALGAIGAAVREQFVQPVIGVTGSCGKTSTKEMLRCLLGAPRTHATSGNWNNRIGVPMTLMGLADANYDFAVIEAGINQPEEMQALGQMIQADLNLLTNIGPAHLELLGSLENIASEKSMLAVHAREASPILLPAEALQYPAYAQMAERAVVVVDSDDTVQSFKCRARVDFAITASKVGQQELTIGQESFTIHSASRGIASNAALAITAARVLGIDELLIRPRIEGWRPVGSRGRVERVGGQTFYIDCYNANPASMVDALEAFASITPPDVARCFVIGAMNELGDYAEAAHRKIGQGVRVRSHDHVHFVGPKRLTQAYRDGAVEAGVSEKQINTVENVESLESMVAAFSGAIFLKGSRAYQLERLLPATLCAS